MSCSVHPSQPASAVINYDQTIIYWFCVLRLAITLHGENRSHAAAEGRAANREDSTHATGLLTLRDVTGMTALSRSAVYALMAESQVPEAHPYRGSCRAMA